MCGVLQPTSVSSPSDAGWTISARTPVSCLVQSCPLTLNPKPPWGGAKSMEGSPEGQEGLCSPNPLQRAPPRGCSGGSLERMQVASRPQSLRDSCRHFCSHSRSLQLHSEGVFATTPSARYPSHARESLRPAPRSLTRLERNVDSIEITRVRIQIFQWPRTPFHRSIRCGLREKDSVSSWHLFVGVLRADRADD